MFRKERRGESHNPETSRKMLYGLRYVLYTRAFSALLDSIAMVSRFGKLEYIRVNMQPSCTPFVQLKILKHLNALARSQPLKARYIQELFRDSKSMSLLYRTTHSVDEEPSVSIGELQALEAQAVLLSRADHRVLISH